MKKTNDAIARLNAMIKAQKAGKLISVNRRPDQPAPKRNFEDIPDDITVYASLK